jgi:hypothetical protein
MKPADIHQSIKELNVKASADLDCRVHADIDGALADSQKAIPVHAGPHLGRHIMRNPMIKLAAAAVVVIAVVLGLNPFFKGTVTVADVIRPILYARTVAFDFVVGEETSDAVVHDIVVGNRIRRTVSNLPITMVIDLDNAKMLTLDPRSKGAAYVDIQGQVQEGTQSILSLVRDVVQKIADHPEQAQDLGRREIDGISTVGFQIKNATDNLQIWADLTTAAPVRIELYGNQSVVILKNIQFDIPVDDSLVSMDVPPGYAAKQSDLKMGDFTEEDVIEGLRAWAQVVNDGVFPDTISAQACMEQMPTLQEKLGRLNLPAEEAAKLGMGFGKTAGFLTLLDYQGEWHYAGKGVTLGDAQAAVFWYRRGGVKTYRVIYGDLHVEEVELDRVPQ